MQEGPSAGTDQDYDPHLRGTTYKVYRYMLRHREPVGVSQIKEALSLSSPSVSEYHIKKLLRLGLIREEGRGYVVDKIVLENVVRIRRTLIPLQIAYVAYFGILLVILLLVLRPAAINSIYFFALAINCSALLISTYETLKTLKRF